MSEVTPLHRLFGLSWMDFFQGTSVTVETELDLSLKQQFLDVLLIKMGPAPLLRRLPDGFELAVYNLVTFKSHQETLDYWALWELVGHFVNYRKQSSPSLQKLLPESDYRLFAACARFPQKLAKEEPLVELQQGVYRVRGLGLVIKVIVLSELPLEEQNAMLHLFSANVELVRYGQEHYRPHSRETSSLLLTLFNAYSEEADMPDKLKEFARQTIDKLLATLPAEERLKGMPAEERLKGMPAEERLKGMPAEERLKGMPAEERLKGLSADEVLKALPPETLDALARQLKGK
jgi:hypothetical protein